jgi:phage shock protein E
VGLFSQLFNSQQDFNLDSDSFLKKINEGSKYIILDVRTKEEFFEGHIINSLNIDIYNKDFREKINSLDRQKTYFVYCRSGHRSHSAVKFMHNIGFDQVYNLKGGIIEWKGIIER